MRKRAPVLATVLLLLFPAAPLSAQEKGKDGVELVSRDVELLTPETPALYAGDTAWIALSWLGEGGDASGFRVELKKAPDGVEVGYPANTVDHSSLWADDTLSDGELDFTALKVTLPYDARKEFSLLLEVTHTQNGRTRSRNKNVKVRVVQYTGDDLQQVTSSLGPLALGGVEWLGVSYTGLAPRLDDFRLTVTDPSGAVVTYPRSGTSTSLHHDATLEDGETDVARFLVDTAGLEPGTYAMTLRAEYTKDSLAGSLDGTVTFEVAPSPATP